MTGNVMCAVVMSLAWLAMSDASASCGTLPDTMRAVRVHAYGGAEQLRLDTVARPEPAAGEVLVRMHSASVNPIDWKLREGLMRSRWPLDLPAITGRDGAGVVVAVGADVTDIVCGDAVVMSISDGNAGSFADYVAVPRTDVAMKPASLGFAEAAAYPLVAVTAWNAVEAARIAPGDRVLIQGGSGGVGSIAVQLAKARGAHVLATASARNAAFLERIGVDEVIDYRAVEFETVAGKVSAVIDTVGGEVTTRSIAVVEPGGRLISIASRPDADACTAARITCLNTSADRPQASLPEIGRMIEAGQIVVEVEDVFPLEQAGAAQERNREGRTRGKLVVRLRDDAPVAR